MNAGKRNFEIHLRQIGAEDFEFLRQLHDAALKEYVAATWGWDEGWQRRNFAESFDPAVGKIIVADNADAGFWWTIERETEIVLASVRLLPEFQNNGIGGKLIRDLLEKTTKPVRLQVLKVNPARMLYERLGFEIFGETETHFLMATRKL